MSRLGKTHFRLVQIQKIERRPCNRPVYNLAVEEDESYVADDVVVHNCRSILTFITTECAAVSTAYWSAKHTSFIPAIKATDKRAFDTAVRSA